MFSENHPEDFWEFLKIFGQKLSKFLSKDIFSDFFEVIIVFLCGVFQNIGLSYDIPIQGVSIQCTLFQSQKTQGFCVADFATLSDERKSRSKIFPLFIWMNETWVRKFEGLERSKRLGISQTNFNAEFWKAESFNVTILFFTNSKTCKLCSIHHVTTFVSC